MKRIILLAFLAMVFYCNPLARADLIAQYKMDDNAGSATVTEWTGKHNGTFKDATGDPNTNAHTATGKKVKALDFDGTDDYIEIADHADFSPGDGSTGTPFSISAWVYMHDATTFCIANKGKYNSDGEWHFFTGGNDTLNIYIYDESVPNCRIGRCYDTALTDYQTGGAKAGWIHLVATYDGSAGSSAGIKLYLNGLRVDNTNDELDAASFVAVENDLGHAVRIGRYDTYYANGKIDDVRIYDHELKLSEIRKLYYCYGARYQHHHRRR